MKKLSIFILLVSFFSVSLAQKDAYIYYSEYAIPQKRLDGHLTVYVDLFQNDNTTEPMIQSRLYLREQIIRHLQQTNYRAQNPMFFQYTHTDRFIVVENPAEADLIISGKYTAKIVRQRDKSEVQKQYSVDDRYRSIYYKKANPAARFKTSTPVPYTVPTIERTFTYKNAVDLELMLYIKDKSGAFVYADTASAKDEYTVPNCVGRHCGFPADKEIESMEKSIISKLVPDLLYKVMPQAYPMSIRLIDVEASDKELKKLLKKPELNTAEDLLAISKVYREVFYKENIKDAARNVSTLYYLLGYYDDAAEWLKLSESTDLSILEVIEYNEKNRREIGPPLKRKKLILN